MELSQEDLNELARLIADGNIGGIIDGEGYRISWELKADKFDI